MCVCVYACNSGHQSWLFLLILSHWVSFPLPHRSLRSVCLILTNHNALHYLLTMLLVLINRKWLLFLEIMTSKFQKMAICKVEVEEMCTELKAENISTLSVQRVKDYSHSLFSSDCPHVTVFRTKPMTGMLCFWQSRILIWRNMIVQRISCVTAAVRKHIFSTCTRAIWWDMLADMVTFLLFICASWWCMCCGGF